MTTSRKARSSFDYSAALNDIDEMMNNALLSSPSMGSPSSDGIYYTDNSASPSTPISTFSDLLEGSNKTWIDPLYFPPMREDSQKSPRLFQQDSNAQKTPRFVPASPYEWGKIKNAAPVRYNPDSRAMYEPKINHIQQMSSMKQNQEINRPSETSIQITKRPYEPIIRAQITMRPSGPSVPAKWPSEQKTQEQLTRIRAQPAIPLEHQERINNINEKVDKMQQEPNAKLRERDLKIKQASKIKSTTVTFIKHGQKREELITSLTTAYYMLDAMQLGFSV
jgi:hypothetical protein